jgi:hypothetical protein
MVHITENYGPSRDKITATTKRHLCEPCGDKYQRESQQYLEHQSSHLQSGMSKAAMQKLRDDMRQHMSDWISQR